MESTSRKAFGRSKEKVIVRIMKDFKRSQHTGRI